MPLPFRPRLVHSRRPSRTHFGGLSEGFGCGNAGVGAMRDIRNDLTQRARLVEDHIAAAYGQFEQRLEQLQAERDGRVAELQSELAALSRLIESEHRRVSSEERRMGSDKPLALPQVAPQTPLLADFIMHKLNEMGPLSKDDLVNLSLQEGVFADPESADHGIHGMLVSVIRSEHIRQLHDGTFVPNTLPPALRMRHAG